MHAVRAPRVPSRRRKAENAFSVHDAVFEAASDSRLGTSVVRVPSGSGVGDLGARVRGVHEQEPQHVVRVVARGESVPERVVEVAALAFRVFVSHILRETRVVDPPDILDVRADL